MVFGESLKKLFGKNENSASTIGKRRIQLMIEQDKKISSSKVEAVKKDLIAVMKKHFDFKESEFEILAATCNDQKQVEITISIPDSKELEEQVNSAIKGATKVNSNKNKNKKK